MLLRVCFRLITLIGQTHRLSGLFLISSAHWFLFLLERYYVTFGYLLLQICLLSVTFVLPTQGVELSATFLRCWVP